jgi:hypothetical protein
MHRGYFVVLPLLLFLIYKINNLNSFLIIKEWRFKFFYTISLIFGVPDPENPRKHRAFIDWATREGGRRMEERRKNSHIRKIKNFGI